MEIAYDANDNRLRVRGVKGIDGVAIADATVRVTSVLDDDDDPVEDIVVPLVLPADATAGEYSVMLSHEIEWRQDEDGNVDESVTYRAMIELDTTGRHGEGELKFRVKQRKA